MVGQNFGSYAVIGELGRGGMGAVYLGRHAVLDQLAAIKVLLPTLTDPGMLERFFNEARATAQLRHPNIVQVFDCAQAPSGQAYIVMEYLRGESVGAYISRMGALANRPELTCAIGYQAAEALATAHAQGMIHRDVKPDNIYLDAKTSTGTELVVKVLDFGIAKLAAETRRNVSVTRTGSIMGTPLYMSPEQCRSSRNVDARSDIYSLGCILFEMFAGRTPFLGDEPGALISAHLVDAPPMLIQVAPSAPPRLSALIAQMLEKHPDQRPASMKDVARELAQFCDPESVRSGLIRVDPPARVLVPGLPVHATIPAPAPERSRISGRTELDAPSTEFPRSALAGRTKLLPATGEIAADERPGYRSSRSPAPSPPAHAPRKNDSTLSEAAGDQLRRSRGPAGGGSTARKAIIATALGAAAVGGILFSVTRGRTPDEPANPATEATARPRGEPSEPTATRLPSHVAPATAPATARAVPVEPATVEVNVEGIPRSGRLLVDGTPRSSPVRLARGREEHTFVVEAPGSAPRTLRIDALRDRVVNLDVGSLAPVPEAPVAAVHRHGAPGSSRPRRPAPSEKTPPATPLPAVKGHGDGLFTDF